MFKCRFRGRICVLFYVGCVVFVCVLVCSLCSSRLSVVLVCSSCVVGVLLFVI